MMCIYYLGHINLPVIVAEVAETDAEDGDHISDPRSVSQRTFEDHRDVRTPRRYDVLNRICS